MHNSFAMWVAAASVLFTFSAAKAQTSDECEKLKNDNVKLRFENANLRKGIIARSPASLPPQSSSNSIASPAPAPTTLSQPQPVDKVTFSIVKCQGNAKGQTVTVTLLLTNTTANRNLQFERVKAVDENGEEYQTFDIHIGAGGIRNSLATRAPVKAVFVIPKVLPTTKAFTVLACPIYDDKNPGRTLAVEFRNVVIA